MGQVRFRYVVLSAGLVASLLLADCGGPANKIGSTVKGDRLSILPNAKEIRVDPDLHNTVVTPDDVLSAAAWPQPGFDAAHHPPNMAFNSHPSLAWTADIGEGSDADFKLLSEPVVADGRVYTMDAGGNVSSFDASTGNQLWRIDTAPTDAGHQAIGGGLAVKKGTVLATTGFGEVVALSAVDGVVLWRRNLSNPARSAPTVAVDKVFAVTINNELQALDLKTGETLWGHNGIVESATLMGASNPAVDDNNVIVAYSSGEIFNLRGETGRVAWSYGLTTAAQVGALPAIADIRGLPVIDRGQVIAISHSGRIAAIDLHNGERAWENDIGGVTTPVVSGNAVFVLDTEQHLIALDRETGRIFWVHDMPHVSDPKDKNSDKIFWSGPTLAENQLWMVNNLGQLVGISVVDGNQNSTIDFGDAASLSPVVADGTLYVVTDNGKLKAFK